MEGPTFFENLSQDIRYAGRTLRRSPGFMATAIVALALGIGGQRRADLAPFAGRLLPSDRPFR